MRGERLPVRRPAPRPGVRRRAKSRAELAPVATVGARAVDVVTRQAGLMRANLAAAVDGRDPEGVHDMRVASRRLRASLAVLETWLPEGDLGRVEPGLRAITRALGAVREIDVNRALLARLRVRATPARSIAIEDVDARLARRLRRARSRMLARFARVDLDRLDARLGRLAEHLRAATSAAPSTIAPDDRTGSPTTTPGVDLLADALASAGAAIEAAGPPEAGVSTRHPEAPIAELLREAGVRAEAAAAAIVSHPVPAAVGTPEAHEAIHRVRIATKKLRYLVEILAPELGESGGALVKRLRRLQDHLGEFHDDVVLDAEFADAIRRAANRGRRLLAAELRRLRRARQRALLRQEQAVRDALVELRERDFAAEIRRGFEAALDACLASAAAADAAAAPGPEEPGPA